MSAPSDDKSVPLHSMTTSSNSPQARYRSLSGGASGDKAYDEERTEWGSVSLGTTYGFPKKYMRLPRLRRVAVCLLVIDLLIVILVVHAFGPLITLLRRNEELFGARLTFPVDDPSSPKPDPDRQTIPRILHQTTANATVPEKWAAAQQSCKDVYADWEYKHWTDESARNFIAAEYPEYLEIYDGYAYPIIRADAMRYFFLHHYGGVYLDMDTICNETFPLHQLEADGEPHHAVFKSTKPTGVSNDLMISSPHHPLFTRALKKLVLYNDITKYWARFQPYGAIMITAGPLFITMAIKDYLLDLPSLPTPTFQVINATELIPYITDLEACSWHHADAQALMWIGDRPFIWFGLGAIGLAAGIHVTNHFLLKAFKRLGKVM